MELDKILNYYKEIHLGKNDICTNCIKINHKKNCNLSSPNSMWKVGQNFSYQNNKILFVGKVARGENTGPKIDNLFEDSTALGDKLLLESSWAYWNYTREIIKNIYGNIESGKEKIAFTNMVKCNDSINTDKTTGTTKNHCIEQLGVIWNEIKLLRPNKIIFYTHFDYDRYITSFRPTYKFRDITNITNRIKIGAKKMPWWERAFYDENGNIDTEFLRIGHPERKNKIDFVREVTNWIKRPVYSTYM